MMIKKTIFNRWTMGMMWVCGLLIAGAETEFRFWWVNFLGLVIFGGVALIANLLVDE
jgi:hypothetical protein